MDEVALTTPSARLIRLYLRLNGWTRSSDAPDATDVWSLPSDAGPYELISPTASSRDFASRVAELLRTLSIVEDRSEGDVLRDLVTVAFDVQYMRTGHAGPPGTAPLKDAADAIAAAQNLLAASTATLEEPRLVLPSRRPAKTSDLMKRVLAGPTTAGSYVISTWVPVPPRLTQDEDLVLFDDTSEPFERLATRQLSRTLGAAQDAVNAAINSDVGLDAFISREQEGLSANLCEALVALAGEQEVALGINLSWALDRPVANVASEFGFDREAIPVLREAARELRERLPEEEVRVRGNVVRLHRDGISGSGDVTIAGVVTGDTLEKMRRVSVSLSEPDYADAITAHEQFADVEVVGALYQRGTRTYLRDARAFSVHPPVDQE